MAQGGLLDAAVWHTRLVPAAALERATPHTLGSFLPPLNLNKERPSSTLSTHTANSQERLPCTALALIQCLLFTAPIVTSVAGIAPTIALFFFFCHRLISAESANPPARLIHKTNLQERLLFTALALNSACYLQRLFVQWV